MKPVYKYLAITTLISVALGCGAIWMVVDSQNGYVAGFVYFPLLILIGASSFILILVGLITITKKVGPFLLLAALLLPGSFFGSALVTKHFEWGAYREDPMVPLVPEVSNIVLFKQGVTNDEINGFWDDTISTKREDGRGNDLLPGIGGVGRLSARDGHEVVEFNFFQSATNEQREYVFSRVRSSLVVFTLLENVPTKPYMPSDDLPSNDNRPKKEMKLDNTRRID